MANNIGKKGRDYANKGNSLSVVATVSLAIVLVASFYALVSKLESPVCIRKFYNSSALGKPIILDDGSYVYEVVIVTDLDTSSKETSKENVWKSYLKRGFITLNKDFSKASVVWQDGKEIVLYSSISSNGRSMELSDLAVFNGNLMTIDDRTGLIYKIIDNHAVPWVYLSDGDGNVAKGFKGEWIAVKDEEMWVGGLGKEWTTTDGVFQNHNPQWVKKVSVDGCVEHMNWIENYKKLRSAAGIEYPGYMIHESAQWSSVRHKWIFMPRRASHSKYTEVEDEDRGTNHLLIASEDFSRVEVHPIGKLLGSRGFSAFQFIPGTQDQIIVAIKSEEKNAEPVASYITIFDVDSGKILLDDQVLEGKYKYEGIAFV